MKKPLDTESLKFMANLISDTITIRTYDERGNGNDKTRPATKLVPYSL